MITKDLAKLMLIYQFLFMTDNKTNIVKEAVRKLRKKLSKILATRPDYYNEAHAMQRKNYSLAWKVTFGDNLDNSKYISIGAIITRLFESIDRQGLIGDKFMERVIESCFFHSDHKDEVAIEYHSHQLSNAILELFDGYKHKSEFSRKVYNMKQDKILEAS